MDIGVPYRLLTRCDVSALQAALAKLPEEAWTARPIRKASLAAGAHNAADSIVLRHEWRPEVSRQGFPTLQASLLNYIKPRGIPAEGMLPVLEERNSETWVYTFPAWHDWQALVLPVILDVIGALGALPRGVLNRALFVRLPAGASVPAHKDEQPLAAKAHRIHVCLSEAPECVYSVGDQQFTMKVGEAYDFNNRWVHAVDNRGAAPRINMMLEYIPEPSWVAPAPIVHSGTV